MRHRYGFLDPDLIRQLLAEMGLRRLFNHLLLQSGGDVEEAMRWMRALQERGYIDPDVDLDAFFAQLMQENVIGTDGEGNLTLAAGGERLQRATDGFYLAPALITGTNAAMRINREEVFGPVASVIRVRDYDEALAVANDTPFGLTSGVCTTSLKYASHFRIHGLDYWVRQHSDDARELLHHLV